MKTQHRGGTSTTALAAALLASALFLSPPALGEGDESDPITRAIERLDAEDLETREDATRTLLESDALSIEFVEDALGRAGLSPEQRRRLLRVGRKLFGETPRAAMGIMFGQEATEGVVIRDTIESFDARRKLRPDDTVVAIDGRPLEGREQMRYEIISRDPGDVMKLDVIRAGEPIDVDLELGWFRDLNPNAASLDDFTKSRAWELRLARKGISAFSRIAPIDCRPAAGEASASDGLRIAGLVDYEARPVAGGRPRDSLARSASGAYQQNLTQARQEIQAALKRQFQAHRRANEPGEASPEEIQAKIASLLELRGSIERRIESTRRRMSDPHTPDAHQMDLRRIYNSDQTLKRLIDSHVRDLKRQLGGESARDVIRERK